MIREYLAETPMSLIPIAQFKTPGAFQALNQRLWDKDFNIALDADKVVYDILRAEKPYAALVIFGPDGEVLMKGLNPDNSTKYYPQIEDKPPCIVADFKLNIKMHLDKSIFHGLTIVKPLAPIVTAVNNARFSDALMMLKKLPSRGDIGEFKKTLAERIEAILQGKLELFKGLEEAGDKWGAYKVGESILRTFPREKETRDIQSALRKLKNDDTVEDELEARDMFYKVAAICLGSKAKSSAIAQKNLLLGQIAKKYENTEYGKLAGLFVK